MLVMIFLTLSPAGCRPEKNMPFPPPPDEALRSTFGKVGVTYRDGTGTQEITTPPGGAWDGMGRGAATGMLWDLIVTVIIASPGAGGGPFGAIWAFAALAAGVAALPAAALIGSVYGGIAAPSEEEVRAGLATIRKITADLELSRSIALRIAKARGERTDTDLAFLEPGGDRNCFDTVLEVSPPTVLLSGFYGVNPALSLTVRISARLIRVSDGAILCGFELARSRPVESEFLEWVEEEGCGLHLELAEAIADLADRFVDEFFLLRLLPENREWKASP